MEVGLAVVGTEVDNTETDAEVLMEALTAGAVEETVDVGGAEVGTSETREPVKLYAAAQEARSILCGM